MFQALQFIRRDVFPFIFGKAAHEKQAIFIAKGDQHAIAVAFTAAGAGDAFFIHAAAEVGVIQLILHFARGFYYRGIADAFTGGEGLEGFGEINVGHSLSCEIYTRLGYISRGLKTDTGLRTRLAQARR